MVRLWLLLERGSNGLGFLFLYELFTKSFDARISREDSTIILAMLFMRFLPNDEITKQSTYMSILRIMALNYKKLLEKDDILPKYEDTRTIKLSLMFRNSSILSKLMKEVVDKLFKLREELNLKSEFPKRYSPSPSLKVHSMKSYMQTNYAWIVCDTKKQDCTKRKFTVPLKVDNTTLVDKTNMVALATMPLGVIGLEKYIQFHSYHATSNTLEKLPFNIDNHPYAKSHIARQMISRLEDDIAAHAKMPRMRKPHLYVV